MSNSPVTIRLEMDVSKVFQRFSPRFIEAQKYVDNAVIKDCDPFVPFRDGILSKSPTLATKLGSGQVVYNTPYARRQYYVLSYKHNRDKHPQASAQWFEKGKAVHQKNWISGAEKIIKE